MIYNNDCYEIFKKYEDGYFDTILTDPPYGMNFQSNWSKSGPLHDKIEGDENLNLDWIGHCYRLTKVGGCIITFCEWKNSNLFFEKLLSVGYTVKSQVIWDRQHHGMGDLTGSFAPQHDIIWYASKGRRKFANGRPKSIISVKRPSGSQNFNHPTCKPVELLKQLLTSTDDGTSGIVFDPFMGTGSTGVAARQVNREFVGTELKQEYFNTAKERMND